MGHWYDLPLSGPPIDDDYMDQRTASDPGFFPDYEYDDDAEYEKSAAAWGIDAEAQLNR